ncbi:site-specific integrase [Lysinibacillus capsici]|uniref:site-specific integrase n=1 Tax=Lysinibacillus capsici TaxID=2115968 RepID=UPI0021534BC1|nr:site-specific integrase [Lysinibacillus capsici]MCR6522403.1 tyrosine-type recombinase/integrase [Lysinibacillus capsici]
MYIIQFYCYLIQQTFFPLRLLCKQILLKHGKQLDDQLFVFINTFNNLLHGAAINKMFRDTILKAGILNNDGEPKITFHGLRHTHATILLNSGQNVKAIAQRLGNTPAMIYEIYGHVMKELEEQSVEVFSRSLNCGTGASIGLINLKVRVNVDKSRLFSFI